MQTALPVMKTSAMSSDIHTHHHYMHLRAPVVHVNLHPLAAAAQRL
jgi:hypothetical protein